MRLSFYVHALPVGSDRILIIHAPQAMRLPAGHEIKKLPDFFAQPREQKVCVKVTDILPYTPLQIESAIAGPVERQILISQTPEEEAAKISALLSQNHGRDPSKLLEQYLH